MAGLALACATPGSPSDDARRAELSAALDEAAAPPDPGVLEVRLAFASDVDLDLYVSDPRRETVYYANTPSLSGGELVRDRRCDDVAPGAFAVERVRFVRPLPGRYRVGVDFPEACGDARAAAFGVRVNWGDARHELRDRASLRTFDSRVLEFELGPDGALVPVPAD